METVFGEVPGEGLEPSKAVALLSLVACNGRRGCEGLGFESGVTGRMVEAQRRATVEGVVVEEVGCSSWS